MLGFSVVLWLWSGYYWWLIIGYIAFLVGALLLPISNYSWRWGWWI